MFKAEKEVYKALFDNEEAVIKEIEKSYMQALKEIETRIKILQADEMTQSKIYQINYQKALKAQVEGIIEKLHGDNYTSIQQYLKDCYTDSYVGTMYALHAQGMPVIAPIDQDAAVRAILTDSKINDGLYASLGVDAGKLKTSIRQEIARGLSTGSSWEDIARNISFKSRAPLSRAKTIVRTEGHRVQQASSADARDAAKEQGCDVLKMWDATLDGETRDTHRELDGQIRETDKPFESSSGRTARYPGDFGDPAEDCNCRCVALTRARWELDASELQTLKDRAKFFGLDKTDSFKDFEKKYLKAAETVEKSGKSGIIEGQRSVVKDAISSGAVITKINAQKQGRHIKASPTYIKGRSYINGTLEDAQSLIDELSGTGVPLFDANGNWLHKERVQAGRVYGVHVDPETAEETETSKGMIIYSKTGTHLIPRKEDKK